MIASLSGTVQKIEANSLVIQVGGIGVRVNVPRTVLEDVGEIGRRIVLHTYLQVREDALSLYGFETEEDLQLFEVLLGVNGVGPRLALAILGTLSPELLKSAVMREEAAVLQRVPGVGKKTAERIMFYLRDKLKLDTATTAIPLVSDVDADVIDILTGLGFSIIEAQSALQHVPREISTIDERVGAALRYLDHTP
ncbi:MAG: Holliday junction branch migration protein RuvA [Anaerolineae bacterium]|nr:Holliday junction branch migration protein RuvA [Promineifilum sp.]MCZ2114433.1 Holliday junction branch migration protein RuvA [Anaerolineae bacterium]